MTVKRLYKRLLRGDHIRLADISPTLKHFPMGLSFSDSNPRHDGLVIALNNISRDWFPDGTRIVWSGNQPPTIWLADRADARERLRAEIRRMSHWREVPKLIAKAFWTLLPRF